MSSSYVRLLLGLSIFVMITQCGAKKRKHECQNSAECLILKGTGFSCIKKLEDFVKIVSTTEKTGTLT